MEYTELSRAMDKISEALLWQGDKVPDSESRVNKALAHAKSGEAFLALMKNYARWNSEFAGGVAVLTSLISRMPQHFQEDGFPTDLSDRATYIASYIFDAARDEFDDHINQARDSHRTLAQACLIGIASFYDLPNSVFETGDPQWLKHLNTEVLNGYSGNSGQDIYAAFQGLGYHLGSEKLADREFSIIDTDFRMNRPELFEFMKRKTVKIADVTHRAYSWIGIHSGLGGGAEADHFDYGLRGTAKALMYLRNADRDLCILALQQGFNRFERDHAQFFARAIE